MKKIILTLAIIFGGLVLHKIIMTIQPIITDTNIMMIPTIIRTIIITTIQRIIIQTNIIKDITTMKRGFLCKLESVFCPIQLSPFQIIRLCF
jgi:hypothetical protein